MRLGFAAYSRKNGMLEARDRLLPIAASQGMDCVAFDEVSEILAYPLQLDALVVVGGDGSLLRCAGAVSERDIPVLGVNLGRIGFLSEISVDEFAASLIRLERKEYTLEKHMMLTCRIGDRAELFCLNDFMVFKRTLSGVAQIELTLDSMHIGTVYCDGIIIATPTGSTAYSLSAGGPVLAPGLDAVVVTPVCSHTLHMRPFVASPDALLTARVVGEGLVSADGVHTIEVNEDDCIRITRTNRHASFIRFDKKNIFELIKTKLS